MKTIVVSPRCASASARELAEALGVDYYSTHRVGDVNVPTKVINWGFSGDFPRHMEVVVNQPRAVRRSINKLRSFELLYGHAPLPEITLDRHRARELVERGNMIVMRNQIKGSQSAGLVITNILNVFDNTPAKFFAKYIPHSHELRINCYKGSVVSVYNKVEENQDFEFKYVKGAEKCVPKEVQDIVSEVHKRIGVDIYGLDTLVTEEGKYYFLEVNSAPVLFPITLRRLVQRIKNDNRL